MILVLNNFQYLLRKEMEKDIEMEQVMMEVIHGIGEIGFHQLVLIIGEIGIM